MAEPGVSVIPVETAERPLLVSLLLGGRLRADSGAVLVDGVDDADDLRRRTALVDTPVVAEPTGGIALSLVVAEEFSFAGLPASRGAVRAFLEQHELLGYAKVPIRSLPPVDRCACSPSSHCCATESMPSSSPHPSATAASPPTGTALSPRSPTRGITVIIVTDAATADALAPLQEAS